MLFFNTRMSSFSTVFLIILDKDMERTTQSVLEKVDLLLMAKRAAEKDCSLKTQLLVSKSDSSSNIVCSKKIWSKRWILQGCEKWFRDGKGELSWKYFILCKSSLFDSPKRQKCFVYRSFYTWASNSCSKCYNWGRPSVDLMRSR